MRPNVLGFRRFHVAWCVLQFFFHKVALMRQSSGGLFKTEPPSRNAAQSCARPSFRRLLCNSCWKNRSIWHDPTHGRLLLSDGHRAPPGGRRPRHPRPAPFLFFFRPQIYFSESSGLRNTFRVRLSIWGRSTLSRRRKFGRDMSVHVFFSTANTRRSHSSAHVAQALAAESQGAKLRA